MSHPNLYAETILTAGHVFYKTGHEISGDFKNSMRHAIQCVNCVVPKLQEPNAPKRMAQTYAHGFATAWALHGPLKGRLNLAIQDDGLRAWLPYFLERQIAWYQRSILMENADVVSSVVRESWSSKGGHGYGFRDYDMLVFTDCEFLTESKASMAGFASVAKEISQNCGVIYISEHPLHDYDYAACAPYTVDTFGVQAHLSYNTLRAAMRKALEK